jgi:hypothetical protein
MGAWQEAEDALDHSRRRLTATQAVVVLEGFCVLLVWVELSRHRPFGEVLSGAFRSGFGLGPVLSHAFF